MSPVDNLNSFYQTISRRKFFRQVAGLGMCVPLSQPILPILWGQAGEQHTRPATPPIPTSLSPEDDQFLEEMERLNFCYFWEQTDPQTGLIKDRCNARTN